MRGKLIDNLKKQKKILESQGHSIAYLSVYGSQNYGLDLYNDEYQSDIDMKAIIVPTLNDLVKDSKPISTTIETEWGQCDLKDIRTFFKTLLKANPSYIETIFTDYYIVDDKFKNEFDYIFALREDLVKVLSAQFVRAAYGMMCEKEKALFHPYSTIKHKIDKFGYDGKQLSHAYRLWYLMQDYFNSNNLKNSMHPNMSVVRELIDYKLNKPTLEVAKNKIKEVMGEARQFRDEVLIDIDEGKMDYSIKNYFIDLSQTIIENKIIEECRK